MSLQRAFAWGAAWLLVVGCRDRDRADEAPEQSEQSEPSGSARPTEPWRYEATFENHLPSGAVGVPVLELRHPVRGQVQWMAVVARAEPKTVRLELWRYDQDNPREVLEPEGEPATLYELGAEAMDASSIDRFRRQLATPQAELTRPLGIEGENPEAAIHTMASMAKAVGNEAGKPEDRAATLAALLRGVTDRLLLEQRALPHLLAILQAEPTIEDIEPIGRRRVRVHLEGDRTAVLELARKGNGWAVTSLSEPKPPEQGASTADPAGP